MVLNHRFPKSWKRWYLLSTPQTPIIYQINIYPTHRTLLSLWEYQNHWIPYSLLFRKHMVIPSIPSMMPSPLSDALNWYHFPAFATAFSVLICSVISYLIIHNPVFLSAVSCAIGDGGGSRLDKGMLKKAVTFSPAGGRSHMHPDFPKNQCYINLWPDCMPCWCFPVAESIFECDPRFNYDGFFYYIFEIHHPVFGVSRYRMH